jgi:hypothetical protein
MATPKTSSKRVPTGACMITFRDTGVVTFAESDDDDDDDDELEQAEEGDDDEEGDEPDEDDEDDEDDDAEASGRPLFAMSPVASGNPIMGHWYWGNLALDLEGVQLPQRAIPALKDHDPDQRVGFATRLEVEDGVGLVARGELLPNSASAQAVQADAADGFPWQSSVHAVPLSVEQIEDGQKAEVNGTTLSGPGAIFRQWKVREVSFTALGADDAAQAAVAASHDAETYEVPIVATTNDTPAPPAEPAVALTAEQLQQQHPDQVAELTGAAVARGEERERERVSAILDQADSRQHDLAAQLIADGTPLADATAAINNDLRARLEAALAAGGDEPVARNQPEGDDTDAPAGDTDAQFAAEWDRSSALRNEFSLRDEYVAYRRAEQAGSLRRHAPNATD